MIFAMKFKHEILDYLFILLGTAITGFSIGTLVIPANMAPGGVSGISTIFFRLVGIDPGFMMMCISIPLFLIGLKVFGPLYGMKCLVGSLALSMWVSVFGNLTGYNGIFSYADRMDVLLSAIFGGTLSGIGIGIVMRTGANTGGTDIIAQIINKFLSIDVGTALFMCDGVIIVIGAFVFGLESALFAIIYLFINGRMVNYVVMNMRTSYAKTAFIVTDNIVPIGDRIIKELKHGATLLKGQGIFTGKERQMIMAVVHNRQINTLTRIVHEEDPKAFMFVQETYQALGQGFVPIQKVIDSQLTTSKEKGKHKSKKAAKSKSN